MIIFHMSLAVSIWPILAWKRHNILLFQSVWEFVCVCVVVAGGWVKVCAHAVSPWSHENNKMSVLWTKTLWCDPHPAADSTYLIAPHSHSHTHTDGLKHQVAVATVGYCVSRAMILMAIHSERTQTDYPFFHSVHCHLHMQREERHLDKPCENIRFMFSFN